AARTSLDDTELHAPNDGVILSRVLENVAIVSPADTFFVLSLTEPVWVRSYFAEPNLGRIHPGMKVSVAWSRLASEIVPCGRN
ncbi:HlyD family efflux transporter periplasmic adaptor subunit, partial [Rhizobium ruizarguesonis]